MTTPTIRRVVYPESDGKPMAETDHHRNLMLELIFALKQFLSTTKAYVSGNLFIYFEEGNPRKSVAPDVFVVMGINQESRRTYQTWQHGGKMPDVVIELTSKRTIGEDRSGKMQLYASLGVREYFLFDPFGTLMDPRLQGFRLQGAAYVQMSDVPLRSDVLGLELRTDDTHLRLYDMRTGARLMTTEEEVVARRSADAARRTLELRLIAENDARVTAEEHAEQEAARAEQEAARATAAEEEIARLRALLAARGA